MNLRRILDWRRPWPWLLATVLLYPIGGFLLAPWLLERQLVRTLSERLELDASAGRIAINPFRFTLLIEELEIAQAGGESLLELQRGFVDLELASLWRQVYSFDEIRFDGLGRALARKADGADDVAGDEQEAPEEATEAAYLSALRQRLIGAWPVPDEALQALATSSADSVAGQLESHNPALSERIERKSEPQVIKASDGLIAMELKVAPREAG